MAKPWRTLATVSTSEGALELRQRGDADFLIVIGGRVLMTSVARRSEEDLAKLALEGLTGAPHVLIGGLGMAFTLRASLDALPAGARIDVAELTPEIVAWCQGPLAALTNHAVADPRVRVVIDDVAKVIASAEAGVYDAIVLDLYEGPHAASQTADDPFYGAGALERTRTALAPGGVFGVWSEEPDDAFAKRLAQAGFTTTTHRSGGRGGGRHAVYIGRKR